MVEVKYELRPTSTLKGAYSSGLAFTRASLSALYFGRAEGLNTPSVELRLPGCVLRRILEIQGELTQRHVSDLLWEVIQ